MKGNAVIPLILVVILFAAFVTSGTLLNKSAVDRSEQYTDPQAAIDNGKQNLQLKDVKFTKIQPTPNTECVADSGREVGPDCTCPDAHVTCKGGKCVNIDHDHSGPGYKNATCDEWNQRGWCGAQYAPHDGDFCIGKPVIYLYPEKPTLVDVAIKTEGQVVISDPLYPTGGWKNVLANPDGTLLYQNKTYSELFYETASPKLTKPDHGIIISASQLEPKLREIIATLGLTKPSEQQEFLDWWLPRLRALNSSYIFVSLLDKTEKTRLDNVEISPKPDTFIDFIVYFAPRSTEYNPNPLQLTPAPRRTGFTAIEWGGVVGK